MHVDVVLRFQRRGANIYLKNRDRFLGCLSEVTDMILRIVLLTE